MRIGIWGPDLGSVWGALGVLSVVVFAATHLCHPGNEMPLGQVPVAHLLEDGPHNVDLENRHAVKNVFGVIDLRQCQPASEIQVEKSPSLIISDRCNVSQRKAGLT